MTLKEWLKENNVSKSVLKSGKYIIAMATDQESCDSVVNMPGHGAIPLKKIEDLETQVSKERDRLFIIKATSWTRMTEKNLWMSTFQNKPTRLIDKDQENGQDIS